MWYFTSGKFFPVLNSSTAKKKKIKKNLKLNLNCHASKEEKKKKTTHKTLQERKKMFMSIVTVQPSTVTG